MNAARRVRLQAVVDQVSALAAEEREAFEGTPESLQATEAAQARESAADDLEEALQLLQGVLEAGS